jgi:transposase
VLLLDRAGWHTTANLDMPDSITPIFLPSRAPGPNPVENIWQYLRSNWLSNRVFDTYEVIIDAACEALTETPRQPTSHRLNSYETVSLCGSIIVTAEITSSTLMPIPN